jgi:hypothetical protein
MAEYQVDVGQDPGPTVRLIQSSLAAAKALRPDWPSWNYLRAYAAWIKASYELASHGDPSDSLSIGMQSAIEQLEQEPSSQSSYDAIGRLNATKALYLLKRGESPELALRAAREAFQRCQEVKPWDLEFRVWRARVELTSLRWLLQENRLEMRAFEAAVSPLEPLLDKALMDPRLYQTMAEIRELEAALLLRRKLNPEAAIRRGLALIEKALAVNPNMAAAFATRGKLLLLVVRAPAHGEDLGARREAARTAEAAFMIAVQKNSHLERDLEMPLREARSVLGTSPS